MPLFITDYPTQVTASAGQPVYVTGTLNSVPSGTQTVTGNVTASLIAGTAVTATIPAGVGITSGTITSVGSITSGVGITSGTLTTVGTVTTVSSITNLASGTVTIRTTGSIPVEIAATSATGSTVPSQAAFIAGNNSGTLRAVNVDSAGNLITVAGGTYPVSQGNAGSNAQAWWTRIGDATNGPVAVKSASAVAVATDPALVVAVSPNNTVTTKEIRSTVSTLTAVTVTTASTTVLASSGSRVGATVFNPSPSVNVYLALGQTPTTSLYTVKLGPGGYYEVPENFTGAVNGIVASSTQSVNVTDMA